MVQLKALSEDDLAHYWRLYVDKLADLLAEADTRPHGPAPYLARRVQSLQREALFLHIRQDPCIWYILQASPKHWARAASILHSEAHLHCAQVL